MFFKFGDNSPRVWLENIKVIVLDRQEGKTAQLNSENALEIISHLLDFLRAA